MSGQVNWKEFLLILDSKVDQINNRVAVIETKISVAYWGMRTMAGVAATLLVAGVVYTLGWK